MVGMDERTGERCTLEMVSRSEEGGWVGYRSRVGVAVQIGSSESNPGWHLVLMQGEQGVVETA